MAARQRFVFHSHINNFQYLYQDATVFHGLMGTTREPDPFFVTRLGRTAVLLYVMSLEALINRAMEAFTPEAFKKFVLERERKLSLLDKWELLPLLANSKNKTFDKGKAPWGQFAELVKLRDEFVHPKYERPAYYEAISPGEWEPLDSRNIPDGLDVRPEEFYFPQTKVPKDPYAIKIEHVNRVKSVVDAIVDKLDELLEGNIKAKNWHTIDQMELIYPPGATVESMVKTMTEAAGQKGDQK